MALNGALQGAGAITAVIYDGYFEGQFRAELLAIWKDVLAAGAVILLFLKDGR